MKKMILFFVLISTPSFAQNQNELNGTQKTVEEGKNQKLIEEINKELNAIQNEVNTIRPIYNEMLKDTTRVEKLEVLENLIILRASLRAPIKK